MIIGISGVIWIYFVGAFFVGLTATFCPLGFKTEIQISSDPAMVGRTLATARFSVLLSRIVGSFVAGIALEKVGIRQIYGCVAGLLLLTAILYIRKIRKRRKFENK